MGGKCCCQANLPDPKNIRSGTIHKMTLVVRDTEESEKFCIDVLGCERIVCPDGALHKRGIRWVRLPGTSNRNPELNSELHFIPISEGTPEQIRHWTDHKKFMDDQDRDMQAWTCAMNTHVGFSVDDLTPVVAKLQQRRTPFFGPMLRADGVYQLYIELPYHHYLEVDARKYDERLKKSTSWAECAKRGGVDREDWEGENLDATINAAMAGNRQAWAKRPDHSIEHHHYGQRQATETANLLASMPSGGGNRQQQQFTQTIPMSPIISANQQVAASGWGSNNFHTTDHDFR